MPTLHRVVEDDGTSQFKNMVRQGATNFDNTKGTAITSTTHGAVALYPTETNAEKRSLNVDFGGRATTTT